MTEGDSLGVYLQKLRKKTGLTLRQVEDATEKEISNAYLSQIENKRITKPSPNILYTLAELYGASYDILMEKAGYIIPKADRGDGEKHGRIATRAIDNLSPEEEEELLDYLNFIRQKKEKVEKNK